MEIKNEKKVTILASGGIDSTALIKYYQDLNYSIQCLHFQYNQPSSKSEKEAIQQITKFYSVSLRIINLPFIFRKKKDEYFGRNAIFLLLACSIDLDFDSNLIAIGIHETPQYYDCSKIFIEDFQQIVDGYFNGKLSVDAPFLHFTKNQIIRFCQDYKVPLKLTYSCLKQNYPPCRSCQACVERLKADEN